MIPARRRAHRPAGRDPRVGRDARGAEAGARPPDGGLCRLPGAHRPPRRATGRSSRGPRRPRGHAHLLHHRGQRGLRGGHDQRELQRVVDSQWGGRARDTRVHGVLASTNSARRRRTTTTPWGGPTPWTPRTNGPSRSPRHWGGTRNGTIVHWPNGFKASGEIRTQFSHVIDVAPTVLEAAGLPEPTYVNGVQQTPMRGRQHGATPSRRQTRPSRHDTQYFEMFVNRGIYHKGWTAVTRHSIPWVDRSDAGARRRRLGTVRTRTTGPRHTTSPPRTRTSSHELQRLFLIEAAKYNVLPLDDRRVERFNPDMAGSTDSSSGAESQLLFGGMGRLSENVGAGTQEQVVRGTAEIEVPEGGADGVIVAQGGAFGGLEPLPAGRQTRLLLQPVRPAAVQGLRRRRRSRPGEHQVRMEFAYDGGGLGKGGSVNALPRWRQGGRGSGRGDGAHDLLGGRDHGCRNRHRHPGERRLRPEGQRVHRKGQMGPARHRRGGRGPRPPHQSRRSACGSRWLASSGSDVGGEGTPRHLLALGSRGIIVSRDGGRSA